MNVGYSGVTVRRADPARPWRDYFTAAAGFARKSLECAPGDDRNHWREVACAALGSAVAAFREQGR